MFKYVVDFVNNEGRKESFYLEANSLQEAEIKLLSIQRLAAVVGTLESAN